MKIRFCENFPFSKVVFFRSLLERNYMHRYILNFKKAYHFHANYVIKKTKCQRLR